MNKLYYTYLCYTYLYISNITGQTDTVLISGVSGPLVFIIMCLIIVMTMILCIKKKQYAYFNALTDSSLNTIRYLLVCNPLYTIFKYNYNYDNHQIILKSSRYCNPFMK